MCREIAWCNAFWTLCNFTKFFSGLSKQKFRFKSFAKTNCKIPILIFLEVKVNDSIEFIKRNRFMIWEKLNFNLHYFRSNFKILLKFISRKYLFCWEIFYQYGTDLKETYDSTHFVLKSFIILRNWRFHTLNTYGKFENFSFELVPPEKTDF